MIVLVAIFDIPAAARAAATLLARNMDVATAAEPGCIHYRHAVDVSDPSRLILSEVWSDAAALSDHFRSAHFRSFRKAAHELGIRSTVRQFSANEVVAGMDDHWKSLLPRLAAAR